MLNNFTQKIMMYNFYNGDKSIGINLYEEENMDPQHW